MGMANPLEPSMLTINLDPLLHHTKARCLDLLPDARSVVSSALSPIVKTTTGQPQPATRKDVRLTVNIASTA